MLRKILLIILIAEANVLQIKQDIRVTFPDKLGVIGSKKIIKLQKLYYAIIVCNFFQEELLDCSQEQV